jgi:hypothetical protein
MTKTEIGLWRMLKETSKPKLNRICLHEFKQLKPCFDEECLSFIDQRKQAKVEGIHDQSQSNVDNLRNVRLGARRKKKKKIRRHFRKLKLRNLKLRLKSKMLGTSIGESVILRRVTSLELIHRRTIKVIWLQTPTVFWICEGTFFSWILIVHSMNDVRQTEIHKDEPLVPDPGAS